MKKKYCFFSAQFLPHMGGVERYTYNLAKKLVQRGNDVVVVTSMNKGLKVNEMMDGIKIYRMPSFNCMNGRYPISKLNKLFWKLHKELKEYRFDLVIVNTRFYTHSLYGMIFGRFFAKACITIEHGTSHLSVHNRYLDTLERIYEHLLTQIDRLFCKDYYGVSFACNKWLNHFNIKAKGVLYNSIDIEEVNEIRTKNECVYRMKFGIPENAIIVTYTGRLLKEKGLPSLLNVADQLSKQRKDVYFLIAGDGDLENEVLRRKTDHIIPLGRLDFKNIVILLTETDIFCLPSYSEGFSTSILEAAACRCYILTTARGGAKELIINRKYGSIIPNNNEVLLYNELTRILDETTMRKNAIELTYERLNKYFAWDVVADQVEKICMDADNRKVAEIE